MDDWKELFGSFLGSLCTTSKGDIESLFEASIPTGRELETKVGFLVTVVVDYSFRMELSIDISGVMEYPFVTNLSTITSSLSFELRFYLYSRPKTSTSSELSSAFEQRIELRGV